MSKGVFVPVPTDLTVEDTTSEKSITEETLWPPEPAPTSSDKPSTLETRKRPGPDRNTESEEPTEDLVTEESTIQGEMTTKTDSGRTVTVPNDKVVTVTRHTTIVTERPPSSSSTLPAEQTVDAGQPSNSQLEGTSSEPFPSVSENLEPASTGDSGPALPQGGIIGIGIGGAALIAFLVGLFLMIKRSRKRRAKQELGNEADSNDQDSGRGDRYDEKHFPQKMSVQSTGTQGSRDPFAPFGGEPPWFIPARLISFRQLLLDLSPASLL